MTIQIERLAGEQALAPAVPVVELDEVLGVQFGAHQLLLHRLLGLARGVEREAVVLVVEPRDLALHPEIEFFVGELVVQELIDLLGVLDLLLDIQILVMRDLFGDQRGEDLPPDLHQLVRGEVVLQHPVVGAALVGAGLRGAVPA